MISSFNNAKRLLKFHDNFDKWGRMKGKTEDLRKLDAAEKKTLATKIPT
jgi:hypothetical protein